MSKGENLVYINVLIEVWEKDVSGRMTRKFRQVTRNSESCNNIQ